MLVEQAQSANFDACLAQLFAQTKFGQLAHRGRLHVDAHTKRQHVFGCLVDARTDACLMKAKCHCEASDPTTDDDYIHP